MIIMKKKTAFSCCRFGASGREAGAGRRKQMLVIQVLLTFLTGGDSVIEAAIAALYMAGTWRARRM